MKNLYFKWDHLHEKVIILLLFALFTPNISLSQTNLPLTNDLKSFETPQIPTTGNLAYEYDPDGSAWTFYGQSGLSKNGTVFTWANPNAPLGNQVLFLQNYGYVETQYSFPSNGYYRFRFKAAWREGCCEKPKYIKVLVDGIEISNVELRSKNYEEYVTLPVYLTVGTHTIRLEGDNPPIGGDYTGFVDDFGIQAMDLRSFETPQIPFSGNLAYVYTPNGSGSAWTFYGQSGLSKNGTVFTWANPNAPLGNQVLFLQNYGYVETEMVITNAGYYRFRFKAAWREGCCEKPKYIRVLVDGIEAGEVELRSKNYEEYVTLPLYMAAGTHTIRLEGDNPPIGGDYTGFVDDFDIQRIYEMPYNSYGVVPAGSTYVISSSTYNFNTLNIQGTLVAPQNHDVNINANYILVEGNGRLQIGQERSPYPGEATITLNGTNMNQHSMGTKFLGAMGSGVIELHGKEKVSWTKLRSTANATSTQIELTDPVDWKVGDTIVIAPTGTAWNEYEERTISAISTDKKDITLNDSLNYKHIGATKSYSGNGQSWTVDMRAEVGLLTRNIKIQGDAASSSSKIGAHVMIMANAEAYINGVELYRVGQSKKIGRYPFHWHQRGNASGQYFKNSSVHLSYNRALTIHRTSNVLVENNFFFDHIGHGIFMEEGNEQGNQILGNLVMGTKRPSISEALTDSETIDVIQNRGPASYWITHPNNTIEDNVATGTIGTGFWYIFPYGDLGGQGVDPQTAAFGSFKNNVAHSTNNGFDIYDELRVDHSVFANVGYLNPSNFKILDCTWYSNNVGIYTGTGANLRVTDEYDRDVYLPSGRGHLIFENNVFADNEKSIMVASNNLFKNSIFVANAGLGNPAISGQTMVHMYDGAGIVSNSHIVGYDSNASSMMSLAGASYTYGNFRFYDVTKANSLFFNIPSGQVDSKLRRNATIYDQDGSISGYSGSTLVINNAFNLLGDEATPSGWTNVKRSSRRYSNTSLYLHLDDAPWVNLFRFPRVRVTRTKNGTDPVSKYYDYTNYDSNINAYVNVDVPTLPFIMNDQNLLYTYDLTPEGENLSSVLPTQHNIIAFELINTVQQNDFVIARFEDLGSLAFLYVDMSSEERVYANQSNLTVTRVYSLSNLKNSTNSAYYIDGSDLYIKAVANGDFAQFFNIKWGLSEIPQTSNNVEGLGEIEKDELLTNTEQIIYPNPVSDKLFIKGLTEGEEVQIVDLSGRLIQAIKYNEYLDVSQLTPGLYILKTKGGSYRFIKE